MPHILEIEAASVDDACSQVQRQGLTVLGARRTDAWLWRGQGAGEADRTIFLRRSRFDVVVFAEQLGDLLGAGLSVIETLETLRHDSAARSDTTIGKLVERLRNGDSLSQAMSADPHFPSLLVALVRAAEFTSDLPQALARFIDHERRMAELRHRITSVAIYPALITLVGLGVMLFLLLYVMPRFARVFEGMNGELPWSAHAMVWWAGVLHAHGVELLVAALCAFTAVTALVASTLARRRMLDWLFQVAPLREQLRTYFLARWYRANGMLVSGGITLPEALSLSTDLLPGALRASGLAVRKALQDGYAPTQAHVRCEMATAVAAQLMLAGERTGDLGSVLTRIAQFHDAEVARSIERVTRAIEPLVMVLIGVGVGVIVVLMYMPIFELASAIQ